MIATHFIASQPNSITFRLTLKRRRDDVCYPHATKANTIVLRGQIDRKDDAGQQRGMKFQAQVVAIATGGKVSNQGGILSVTGANSVTLLVDGATSFGGGDPEQLCEKRLASAAGRSFDALKAEHVTEYQSLFNRVSLDLGSSDADVEALPTGERLKRLKTGAQDLGLIATYFPFGRYLLIGSSRPGGLPANLQGLWAWQMNPPWNADFHTNINVQMNYWTAEGTNLAECHLPLFGLMDTLAETGSQVAKTQYGARGWVAHLLTNP